MKINALRAVFVEQLKCLPQFSGYLRTDCTLYLVYLSAFCGSCVAGGSKGKMCHGSNLLRRIPAKRGSKREVGEGVQSDSAEFSLCFFLARRGVRLLEEVIKVASRD